MGVRQAFQTLVAIVTNDANYFLAPPKKLGGMYWSVYWVDVPYLWNTQRNGRCY